MTIFGIDCSHHQNPEALPWQAIAQRCGFVICRATYGADRDRMAAQHVRKARAAGVRQVGLYHFWRSVQTDADQHAAFRAAAEAAGYQPGDVVPALDVEDDPSGGKLTPALSDRVQEFAYELERSFGGVMLYLTARDWTRLGSPNWMLARPLWVAHYTAAPKPATPGGVAYTAWQYRVGPFEPGGPGGFFKDHPDLDQSQAPGPLPVASRTARDANPLVVAGATADDDPLALHLARAAELAIDDVAIAQAEARKAGLT